MDKRELIERCRENDVKFVRLQFTELYGQLKNISIPAEELEKALDNELMFDGSSIRGFKRIEKSDMYFHPDPSTFQVLPWGERASGKTARIICDVADPDGTPFAGDPRVQLKKVLADAKAEGYDMSVGPEAEFFLFKRGEENRPTLDPHDHASYFDVYPDDLAEDTRRDIEDELTNLGFHLEASHHEVAIGQHEIDFRHADALSTRRQPDHVPLGRQARGGAQRDPRDVHAEAAVRRERLGHAHQPVALARRARTRSSIRATSCSSRPRPTATSPACSSTCRR